MFGGALSEEGRHHSKGALVAKRTISNRIGSERLIFRPDIWRQDPQIHWYAIGFNPRLTGGGGV